MGAFADLVTQAETRGVTKLVWTCDLSVPDGAATRWQCHASGHRPEGDDAAHIVAFGRTGEEALRFVVGALP